MIQQHFECYRIILKCCELAANAGIYTYYTYMLGLAANSQHFECYRSILKLAANS